MSKRRNKENRIDIAKIAVAGVFVLCFIFMVLFSSYISGEEFHHDCSGEDCPICEVLSICEASVKILNFATPIFLAFGIVFAAILEVARFKSVCAERSLVSYKVRLND